jgi:phosphonate transport system substrate-binding protein
MLFGSSTGIGKRFPWRNLAIAVGVFLLGSFFGCHQEDEHQGPQFGSKPLAENLPVYHFAVHPLHNPTKLNNAYQPLIAHLNNNITGCRLVLEASRDYASFEEKYRTRKPEFLLPNPWQTLDAIKIGYKVIAMAGEPQDFKGIFIIRKDSDVLYPTDLKGKSVSYPSKTALAACIMPQLYLYTHGINVNEDIENRYVGSQESSIMNAYLRLTAAGATWPVPWRAFQKEHPQESAELKVIWETESLVNNSVMVRDDVPTQIKQQVRDLLSALDRTPEGKSILEGIEIARFLSASDVDYEVVQQYISRFEKDVRPVER